MQINRQSYEEYFLLYADGELNESEQKAVEEFIDQNPDLAGELSLIQETIFKPDGGIIFENKEVLFKDESDAKTLIYMRWFRIAAAAAILIAFSVVGWVFLGSEKNAHREPVVIVKPEVKKTEPSEMASANVEKKTPVQQKVEEETTQQVKNIPLIAGERKEKQKQKEIERVREAEELNVAPEPNLVEAAPPAKSIEGTAFTQDVVKSEPGRETIDVTVEPRGMENNDTSEEQPGNNVSYAQSFRQEPDNDMIYFANTSLTKKTKLRGVLRKATRYLDRVTSLQ